MIAGYNTQKIDGARVSDLNCRQILIYDESAAFIPELRQRVPDAVIVLRLIQNYHWTDPARTAREGARLCREYPQVDVLCPANEQNFEDNANSRAIAEWCDRFNDAYAAAGAPKPTVSPAMSTGRPFNLHDLQLSWRRFEYIGVHGYATLDDLGFTAALANIGQHRAVWPDKPQMLTETNIEKLEETTYRHGEGAAAFENFLNRLTALGYVKAVHWFLDDSDTWPYRLVRIPPLLDLYRKIGHEQGGEPAPGPTPPQPPSSDPLIPKYNLAGFVHESAETGIALEDVTNGQVQWDVHGPSDLLVVTYTTGDGGNRQQGMGYAGQVFGASSKYFPEAGQHGPWTAECGGARIDGIGMKPDHQHPNVRFFRRSAPPIPPTTGFVWAGAFADYARAHPEVGQPIGDAAYHPEPGVWRTCGQVSATHLLCWDGWKVIELPR
jgi:hypothetical protein